MNQLKYYFPQVFLIACILILAQGKEQNQEICIPLGSVPDGPSGDCSEDGHFVNPANASQFHICTDGIRYDFTCQIGLLFNTKNQYCDWPQNVKCNPLKQQCPLGSVIVIPSQPTDCLDLPDGFHNDPTAPSDFFHCENGKRTDFKCQIGLIFDRSNIRCEWPANMKCYPVSA